MPDSHQIEYPVELTCSQDQIWLAQREFGSTAVYNITFAFNFQGPINLPAFEKASAQLMEEAECLRLAVREVNGRAMQSLLPHPPVALEVLDFRSDPHPDAAFETWAKSQGRISFSDLSRLVVGSTLALLPADRAFWVITVHHLISDGWGLYLLYQRLHALYEAFRRGEPAPEPRLPSFEVLLKADEEYRSSAQFLEDQAYWNAKTKDARGPLPLFGQAGRPGPKPTRRVEFDLPPVQVKRLAAVLSTPEFQGRTTNVALFNFLFTVYAVFLYRISNQRNFMIGVPYLNRPGMLRQAPGLAVEQVPLQVQIEENETFWSLYQKIKEESREVARHSRYPVSNPKNQVYSTVFNLHNRASNDGSDPVETWWYADEDLADLTLDVFNPDLEAGYLKMGLDMAEALFDKDQEKRVKDYLFRTFEQFLDQPQSRVDFPEFISPEELHQLLVEFNPPIPYRASGQLFIQKFAEQVQRNPNALAVEDRNGTLTYRQLDQRAAILTQKLSRLGFKPGSAIGLYLDRSLELAVALIAIFKAGCTYVPLDPAYPAERLSYIAADANVACILTCRWMQSEFLENQLPKVWVDEVTDGDGQNAPLQLLPLPGFDVPAYITYTSGSTGRPKGVVVSHRGMMSYVEMESELLGLQVGDRFLYFAALGFDASIVEFFPTWISGATLVMRPEGLLTLSEFNHLMQEKRITVVSLPAAYWGEWVGSLEEHREALPSSLRILLVYAEEPSLHRYLAWKSLPGAAAVRWVNTYGPTEAVVDASSFEPTEEDGDPAQWMRMPIGRPLPNHRIYILDEQAQPVPIGTPGEIYVGGDISSGYLNLPDETRAAFLDDPFCGRAGQKMYKTRDRGRFLPNGVVQFLGRFDNQVKLRGFRIELGEIENRLIACPGVGQAAVCVKKVPSGAEVLVAYLVPSAGSEAEPERYRDFLSRFLPDYMLPSEYISLPEFPLTVNGKIDFSALPEPTCSPPEVAYQGAQSPLEIQLVAIWEKVLGVSPIGIDQDFFDLGGTSLLGVRLFDQIKHMLGVWLPVAQLFQSPTIRKLAAYIEKNSENYVPSCAVLLRPGSGKWPLFLVHGWGGGVVGYGEIVRNLNSALPVWGLQAAGLLQEQPPDETVAAMVQRYIEAMRTVQPSGPYRLGGYCTGGMIAYAVACELVKQGEQVNLLAIIEGNAPKMKLATPPLFDRRRLGVIWNSIPFWFSDYRQLGLRGIRQRILAKLRSISQTARKKAQGQLEYEIDDIVLDDPTTLPDYQMKLLLAQLKAITNWVPERYPGQVTVYHACYPTFTQALSGPLDDAMGWDQLADGGVQLRLVKAAHRNIHLPPYCYSLAKLLQADLERTEPK